MKRFAKLRAAVRKDLLRQVRAPLGTLLILAFPIIFSGLMALSFGGSGDRVPKVRLLIEDRDGGIVGDLVRSAFASEQAAPYFDVELVQEGGAERIEKNEASALLVLPEGMTSNLLNQEPVTLRLIRNPAEGILPEIAEQVTIVLSEVLDGAVRVLSDPLDRVRPFLEQDGGDPTDFAVATTAVAVNQVMTRAKKYVFPPVIKLETKTRGSGEDGAEEDGDEEEEDENGASPTASVFLLILPGIAVFSLFSLCDHSMRDVLREQDLGTLRRQLAGPISTGELILGKVAVSFIVMILGVLILAGIGLLVGRQGVSFFGFTALTVGLVLAATGTATVVYGLATSERQGATIASTIYLIFGFASGSFVPLSSMPPAVQTIAPFTPFYWATEGFKSLLFEDAGLAQVGLNVGVLLAVGCLGLALGSLLLGRGIRKGVTA